MKGRESGIGSRGRTHRDVWQTFNDIRPDILPVVYALVIVAVLPLLAGYIVLLERKVMAHMQARLGPMRVGPHGLLQPIADAVKLLLKEDITPKKADAWLFWLAPLLRVTMALLAYAALPFGPVFQIADLDVGLLFILAISSLGIYGIVLGGWASNSHYSLLGALRSAAQLVSYETAAGSGAGFGTAAGRNAFDEAIGGGAGPTGSVVRVHRAIQVFYLHDGVDRGNESRAVRFAGGRIGVGGRVHDGI